MKNSTFLFLFCIVSTVFSQEKTTLKGQLVFSSMNISAINIVNLSSHIGTINDANGKFSIEVRVGDEILFSSVQYEPYQLQITQELFDQPWVVVEMVPAVNELEAVTISNIKLSGSLATDMQSVQLEEYFNNASFGMPMPAPELSVEERRLHTASTGGPVGLLINVISGRLKKLKRLKEFSELEALIQKARETMTPSFFVSECGIPEEYIVSFLYFCSEDAIFKKVVAQNDHLILVDFFKQKATEYYKKREW